MTKGVGDYNKQTHQDRHKLNGKFHFSSRTLEEVFEAVFVLSSTLYLRKQFESLNILKFIFTKKATTTFQKSELSAAKPQISKFSDVFEK